MLSLMILLFLLLMAGPVNAQQTGDAAIAARYLAWAQTAIDDDRWDAAGTALERARDFAEASSDISYLRAVVLLHQGEAKGAVLEALRQALETRRWTSYTPEQARFLEAQVLIRLRLFYQALRSLEMVYTDAESTYLRLCALRYVSPDGFRGSLSEALEQYPRDPRFVQLFFEHAGGWYPDYNDAYMLDRMVKRVPLLSSEAPELAYWAAPLVADTGQAAQLVAAYRETKAPDPASVPVALNLGLIDDQQAITEVFSRETIDKDLLYAVWSLLRSDESREVFNRRVKEFSGTITEDQDKDGYSEFTTQYKDGIIVSCVDDFDQDGLPEQSIVFDSGVPRQAVLIHAPESVLDGAGFAFPVADAERQKVTIHWEVYPYVSRAESNGTRYVLRPLECSVVPVRMQEAPGALLYPERSQQFSLSFPPFLYTRVSSRELEAFAIVIERESSEFDQTIERIELDRGIPHRIREYKGERIVSETEFSSGRRVSQRVDLDDDGYLETIRYFGLIGSDAGYQVRIESFVTDWNRDGIFEGNEFWKTR
jgi:hypothetical protein